jgi:hypothetical protein
MKQIICSVIDRPPPDWGMWRKILDREKYKNFDKSPFPDKYEGIIYPIIQE